ncbi:MAG: hypothetical protein ACRC46_14570 [Thermoguttaceae bacterium]
MPENEQQPDSPFRAAAIGYAAAIEVISAFVVVIGLPFFGAWLDGRWGVFPCFFVICLVLGVVSCGLSLWRLIRRLGATRF